MTTQPENGLTIIAGGSQTGKTTTAMRLVEKNHPRAVAWDPENQWGQRPTWQRVQSARALVEVLRKHPSGPIRVAFVPPRGRDGDPALFDIFCRAAFLWLDTGASAAIVAEETSDVTESGKARDWWGALLRRGLKRGAYIFAIMQRPAESDKTSIGNATEIYCHALRRANDKKYMANEMDIPLAELEKLQGHECLYKNHRTGQVQKIKPA